MSRFLAVLLAALLVAGCGKTEKSGDVGDELTAKGVKVTVQKVDRSVPVPARDITGLSTPAPGMSLVGVRAKVCSDHGGAIGQYDFGIETSNGAGRLKFPAMNYPDGLDIVRTGCGDGWVVFEVPAGSRPEKVKFGFQDTGSRVPSQNNQVDARFTWKVPG